MESALERILDRAVRAPSGDNVQPWTFKRTGASTIEIYNSTASDSSLFNYEQIASLLSIGCLLENLRLAAGAEGIGSSINLLIASSSSPLVARVHFHGEVSPGALHAQIEDRCTNRRPYDAAALSAEDIARIREVHSEEGARIVVAEDADKDTIVSASAANEQVVLENRSMHDSFFKHITWTDQEDRAQPGFFVNTLELNPVERFVFRLYRQWSWAKFLNAVGFAAFISRENAKRYRTASAAACILIDATHPRNYVRAGMTLQRVWLTASSMNLASQPLAGVCILGRYARETDAAALSREHRTLLTNAYETIARTLRADNESIAIILRIGSAPRPSARTRRADIAIE